MSQRPRKKEPNDALERAKQRRQRARLDRTLEDGGLVDHDEPTLVDPHDDRVIVRSRAARPVGALMGEFLRDSGLNRTLEATRALAVWDEVVGPEVSEHARAVAIRAGRLQVHVSNPAWLTQLEYLKQDVLERMNERLGPRAIQAIDVSIRHET